MFPIRKRHFVFPVYGNDVPVLLQIIQTNVLVLTLYLNVWWVHFEGKKV